MNESDTGYKQIWSHRTSTTQEHRLNIPWPHISVNDTEKNVVYLKTHKTGSSSVQNVFMRYGILHHLLVAVPEWFNYFGHPAPFRAKMVPPLKPGFHYSIFTHHTRFNYTELKALMPSDTKFVTTMREPASLFESAYAYYYLPMLYNMSLQEFVQHELDEYSIKKLSRRVTIGRIGRNQMAFDLGVEIDEFEDEEAIQRVAETLDEQFDLVMITERMLESLVLLKHLMGWTTDDVVTLNSNARDEAVKLELTSELRHDILKWNKADKVLYDYFSKRFEDRVADFGIQQMEVERLELLDSMQKWNEFCIAGKREGSAFADNVVNLQMKDVNNETCRYLAIPEMDFTKEMFSKQSLYYL